MRTNKADQVLRGILEAMNSMAKESSYDQLLDYMGLLSDFREFYLTYWGTNFDCAYQELLQMLSTPEMKFFAAAYDADCRGLSKAASSLSEGGVQLNPSLKGQVVRAGFLRKSGSVSDSRKICSELIRQYPESQSVLSEIFMCDVAERFWAKDYYWFLNEIQKNRQPRVYIEIGVATGKSLALAQGKTRALGVDPVAAEISRLVFHSLQNNPQLYKITSDDFFNSLDLKHEMGCECFDLAFIDGLHHFDQVLRDFINVERLAGPNSVVLIHDCLPVDQRVATRDRSTAFWTGDVWRIIPCLRALRPDLEIVTLPLAPAGLAMIKKLDPGSNVLSRHYGSIVEQYEQMILPESWEQRCSLLAVDQGQESTNLDQMLLPGAWS